MADYILVAVLAYLIGSIPSGLILGKLFWHTDLREHGSHNIGATNAWRTLGKVPGIAVFIADSLKGQAGVLLGLSFAGTPLAAVIGGLFAIIGHSFSLFPALQSFAQDLQPDPRSNGNTPACLESLL